MQHIEVVVVDAAFEGVVVVDVVVVVVVRGYVGAMW